jgi:hypothetical protein
MKTLSYPERNPTENAASPTGSTIRDFQITLNLMKTFEYFRCGERSLSLTFWGSRLKKL